MIAETCARVGDTNRKRFDAGSLEFLSYPEDCQCASLHWLPEKWESMYNCLPPWQVALDVKEIL